MKKQKLANSSSTTTSNPANISSTNVSSSTDKSSKNTSSNSASSRPNGISAASASQSNLVKAAQEKATPTSGNSVNTMNKSSINSVSLGNLAMANGGSNSPTLKFVHCDFLTSTIEEAELHKRGKQKKHEADIEKDKIKKAVAYMEAVCYFCLCAISQYRLKKAVTNSTSNKSSKDLLCETYQLLQ